MKTTSSLPDKDNPRDAVASSANKATTWPKKGVSEKESEHRSPSPVEEATDGVMEDTERKVAEERVRFQAKLLDVVGQAAIATDLEGKVLYWNRAAEKLYGWSKEEVIGQTLAEFVISEDLRERATEIRAELREGKSWAGEFIVQCKDGSTFPAIVTNTPVHDERDNLVGMIGLSADITERKRAEEALKESEERFRSLVQNVSDVITVVDADGTVGYVSPAIERMLGYRPQEKTGRSCFDLLHPDDVPRARSKFAEALQNPGVTITLGLRMRHRDGSWRHVELSGTNLLDDPSVHGVVINWRDITEPKKAEERLRESEERYRTLVEKVPAIIYINPSDGSYLTLYISPQIEAMLGYTPKEWMATDLWAERIHPDDVLWVLAATDRSRESGEPLAEEYRLLAKDGSVVWVRDEAVLLRDEAGEPLSWQGVMVNISERKRAEEALRESNRRTKDILESITDHFVAVDCEWRYTYINERALHALQRVQGEELTREEFLGKNMWEMYPEAVGSVFYQKYHEALREQKTVHFEAYSSLRDRWVEQHVYPSEEGLSIYFQDITERKALEEKLRESEERFRTAFENSPHRRGPRRPRRAAFQG